MINKTELNNKAVYIRRKLGENELSPIDIFALVQMIDSLTLIFYPLGESISGACFRGEASAIIVVNSAKSVGRQRYTLAHELYHYYFDDGVKSTVCSSKIGTGNENEKKADQFASYLLMPQAALYEEIQSIKAGEERKITPEEIIRLEQYFGISHQAMLVRLKDDGEITPADVEVIQAGIISRTAKMGMNVSLYKPSPQGENVKVLGHYVSQAEKLFKSDIISEGKYEELLLDAFRDDIVFGDESEGGAVID